MRRIGRQTIKFDNDPTIISHASIAGKKEGEGPLGGYFDRVLPDDRWECRSWEECESKLQTQTLELAIKNAGKTNNDIDTLIGGDLINQCTSTSYGIKDASIPFLGIFGACSTMIESLIIGSVLVDGGYSETSACITSSHFCSAERQFRNPLEYGGQRDQASQWTVTGSGCVLLHRSGSELHITHATIGKIEDMGITDMNNMGAAMAPAACSTIAAHLNDTGLRPEDYDAIITGDLGYIGSDILKEIILDEGYDISKQHNDCGKLIFNKEEQDVHSGGSGCGCCGCVLCGYILKELKRGTFNRVMVAATGALMSPVIVEQGQSIASISHAVTIERR